MPNNSLFHTKIFTTTLNTFSPSEMDYFNKFLLSLPNKDLDSHGEFSINQNVLNTSLFKGLKKQILFYSKQYLKSLGHEFEDIQIANSWSNILHKNEEIHKHSHNNSYISGVFYVNEPTEIYFEDPTLNKWHFSPAFLKESFMCIKLTPPSKSLIIFPSFIKHFVPPSPKDNRVSIAFNIIPKGKFGMMTSLLNL